jgi:hypothetical protein
VQRSTRQGGFNIISSFTNKGDLFKRGAALSADLFYLDGKEELEDLYSNWTIHMSFERNTSVREKSPNGEALFNVFAGLLSQKTLGRHGSCPRTMAPQIHNANWL